MKKEQKASNIMIKSIVKSISAFIVSFIVFFINNSSYDFQSVIEEYYLILAYIFTISIISYYFYESESSYKNKNSNSISVRRKFKGDLGMLKINSFIDSTINEIKNKGVDNSKK